MRRFYLNRDEFFMNTERLAALEQAIVPYRQRGFVITSQSEGAITLTLPPEKFSYVFFIFTLILLWPLAIVYLISFNNQKAKSVCLRITSQGYIEVSGYTFEAIAKERRRRKVMTLLVISVLAIIFILILIRVYLSRAS